MYWYIYMATCSFHHNCNFTLKKVGEGNVDGSLNWNGIKWIITELCILKSDEFKDLFIGAPGNALCFYLNKDYQVLVHPQ